MPPNGHKASPRCPRPRAHKSSCQSWIQAKGLHEFDVWRADHPTQSISYDDWKTSHHVAGLSLFFAAADIFNESASSVSFFFLFYLAIDEETNSLDLISDSMAGGRGASGPATSSSRGAYAFGTRTEEEGDDQRQRTCASRLVRNAMRTGPLGRCQSVGQAEAQGEKDIFGRLPARSRPFSPPCSTDVLCLVGGDDCLRRRNGHRA